MELFEIKQKCDLMIKNGVDRYIVAGVYLLFESGCRISSILRLSHLNITQGGQVVLFQGKGSEPLIVRPSEYKEEWLEMKHKGFCPFENCNYMFFYRLFRSYSLTMPHSFGINDAVTASGRKMVAKDVYECTNNIDITAKALGHKRSTSTEFYIANKSEGLKNERGILASPSGEDRAIIVCKNGWVKRKPTRKNRLL